MEVSKEIKTYRIHYYCDKCGEGEMLPTGKCLMTNPPQYPHKCNKCNEARGFPDKYPALAFKVIDDKLGTVTSDLSQDQIWEQRI
jgi:hypothetical protein